MCLPRFPRGFFQAALVSVHIVIRAFKNRSNAGIVFVFYHAAGDDCAPRLQGFRIVFQKLPEPFFYYLIFPTLSDHGKLVAANTKDLARPEDITDDLAGFSKVLITCLVPGGIDDRNRSEPRLSYAGWR